MIEEDIKEILMECNQRNKITEYNICVDNIVLTRVQKMKRRTELFNTDRDAWYEEVVDKKGSYFAFIRSEISEIIWLQSIYLDFY